MAPQANAAAFADSATAHSQSEWAKAPTPIGSAARRQNAIEA